MRMKAVLAMCDLKNRNIVFNFPFLNKSLDARVPLKNFEYAFLGRFSIVLYRYGNNEGL